MKRIIAFMMMLIMVISIVPVFADSADTSWYSDSKSEFKLSTAAQLLGLDKLSNEGKTFKGMTVILEKDITLGDGKTANWAGLKKFAGTIDGQGHSISGMNCTNSSEAGFISTADGCTIKNLSIVNSHFETTSSNNVSAFVAQGATSAKITIEKCYTNAEIISKQYNAGGFVASVGAAAETVASECWFDGSIVLNVRYAAGIIANGEGKKVTAQHCLNTGTVHTNWTDSAMSHIASMIGRNDGNSNVIDCLNLGKISSALTEAGKADAIGSLFGRCSGSGTVTVKNSAALVGTAPKNDIIGTSAGAYVVSDTPDYLTEDELTGFNAMSSTVLDFGNYWTVTLDGYPQLIEFADTTLPVFKAPDFEGTQLRVESDYALRYIFNYDFVDGYKLEDVKLGAIVIPTMAIDPQENITLDTEDKTVNAKTFKVVDVPAVNIFEERDDGVLYTCCITDIDADIARKAFTVRPYVIYNFEGEEIAVYGEQKSVTIASVAIDHYENGDENAKKEFDAIAALKDIYDKFSEYPSRDEWPVDGVWEFVPAFVDGKFEKEYTVGEARYDKDCNAILISDTTLEQFKKYVESLKKYGFKLYTTNGDKGIEEECYQATLYSDVEIVNVTFYPATKKTYITVEENTGLSPNQLKDAYTTNANVSTQLKMLPLKAFGESMVFQLSNGHFIIIDGAQNHNSQLTVEYLEANTPKGQIPVVDAWFFTHAHPDHIYCAMGIGSDPNLVSRVKVEGFYYTWPNDAGVRRESAYNDLCGQIKNTAEAMKNFKTSAGKTTPQYKLHGGQIFYFADMEVQVLQTQDQLFPNEYMSFNCSSTSYMFKTKGQKILIMGDAHAPVCNRLMEHYSKETMKCDFFQSLHHTYNDVPAFFKYIAPEYFVVTGNSISGGSGHNWLKENVKKIFYAGDPEIVFPYNG
ncbi:MAG: MBL fold metallo-hydrolase [Ruminococcaceae bacterium]|nr:MBL fold metallo-hydrolase [Oscillospiraceae bacterium]